MNDVPVLDIDPFDEELLGTPEAFHERLREAGPVVRLEPYGVWAMARFAEVHAALRDHEVFCSSAGVGLSDFRREKPWRPPSLLLEADPPEHTRVRRATARVLSPRVLEPLWPRFERTAEEMVERAVAGGRFDGVTDLLEPYLLTAFPDVVGLPEGGRENLLRYGDMVFNAFGPPNRLFAESMAASEPVRAWIAGSCTRETLAPGSLGARLYAAADDGEITDDEAALLVRSLLSAGLDTTMHGLAWTLQALVTHPGQWAALRSDPGLARPAFEEALRFASPVQTFFRTTTRTTEVAGTPIPAGEKVLLFLGAANRDPRAWDAPDRFDIRRRTGTTHVAFGSGVHACVGAALSRMEAEALLRALVRRVDTLESAGPMRPRPNNTVRGLAALPLRVA